MAWLALTLVSTKAVVIRSLLIPFFIIRLSKICSLLELLAATYARQKNRQSGRVGLCSRSQNGKNPGETLGSPTPRTSRREEAPLKELIPAPECSYYIRYLFVTARVTVCNCFCNGLD